MGTLKSFSFQQATYLPVAFALREFGCTFKRIDKIFDTVDEKGYYNRGGVYVQRRDDLEKTDGKTWYRAYGHK